MNVEETITIVIRTPSAQTLLAPIAAGAPWDMPVMAFFAEVLCSKTQVVFFRLIREALFLKILIQW